MLYFKPKLLLLFSIVKIDFIVVVFQDPISNENIGKLSSCMQ